VAKHIKIVAEIQRLIRNENLGPGSSMPSERELARRFRVSYNTIRYANDLLCREGVINRHHGRGTFVAHTPHTLATRGRRNRIGLLYVDLAQPLHPYSQTLTFAIQRAAFQAGYELIVEEMRTEELLQGKVPEMIRRRSVDALLLDGRVREPHIRFLEDQHMLFVVTGNTPLGNTVPQVRINVEGLAYAMTRELLLAGRSPVWFDVDPGKGELWHVDLEAYRGYAAAVKEFDPGAGSLHLCPIEPDNISKVAAQLTRGGLKNAAVIVHHWASAMLPAALSMHSKQSQEILIVPGPHQNLTQTLSGPNVVKWSRVTDVEEIAEHSVEGLLAILEGKSEQLTSLTMDQSCKLSSTPDGLRMELESLWEPGNAFEVIQYGSGRSWRPVTTTGPTPDPSVGTSQGQHSQEKTTISA